MSISELEVHDPSYEVEAGLLTLAVKRGLYPNHPDMVALKNSLSWYNDLVGHRVRSLKSEPGENSMARKILENMAGKKHPFASEASRFSDHNRKYMLAYLADVLAKKATEALADIDKSNRPSSAKITDEDLNEGTGWGITIPSGIASELAWHDPVMLAEKKKAIAQQTHGKSDFELSSYLEGNLSRWERTVRDELEARRASNPDITTETFRLQNLELIEHHQFVQSTMAWVSAKVSQTIVTDTEFPALEYDAPVQTEPVVVPHNKSVLPATVKPDTIPMLREEVTIPVPPENQPVTISATISTPSKLEIQHLEKMKSIILGEINKRSGDSLIDYYDKHLKPATSMLKSDIEAAKARGNDSPDYIAARERQLSVMLKLSSAAVTKMTSELKKEPVVAPVAETPVIAADVPSAVETQQIVQDGLAASEASGEKMLMPETKKKGFGWLADKWNKATTAAKTLVVGALTVSAGLATAFAIRANNAPEAPPVPTISPVTVAAVEVAPTAPTPTAPVAAISAPATPEAIISPEPKVMKAVSLAKKSFAPVVEVKDTREIIAKAFDPADFRPDLASLIKACKQAGEVKAGGVCASIISNELK